MQLCSRQRAAEAYEAAEASIEHQEADSAISQPVTKKQEEEVALARDVLYDPEAHKHRPRFRAARQCECLFASQPSAVPTIR